MSRARTTGTHRTLIAAGAAAVAVAAGCGVALAAVAAASPTATTSVSPAAAAGIEEIWSQTDAQTRQVLCTTFLTSPDGTWQSIAPVLTAEGVTRAETEALLATECVAESSVADLRG